MALHSDVGRCAPEPRRLRATPNFQASGHNNHRADHEGQDVAPEDVPVAGANGIGELCVGPLIDAALPAYSLSICVRVPPLRYLG